MAKVIWTGQAQEIAQVDTVTVAGTIGTGEVFSIVINNKAISYTTEASDTAAIIAAALQAACAASTITEFTEIDWTVDDAVITATGATEGLPFELTTETDSAAGTITRAAVTAASGPTHWGAADNWSTGSVPAAADSVYIDDADAEIGHSLPSDGRLFADVQIKAGAVGLPKVNAAGYQEYRTQRAVFGATSMSIGVQGGGPSLVRVDLGSDASSVVIYGTSSTLAGPSVDLLLNQSTSTVSVLGGTCGIAAGPGEISTVGTVTVGPSGNATLGEELTATTVTSAGILSISCAATTLNVEGGRTELAGDGAITTVQIRNGQLIHRGIGTITTANVGPGLLDLSGDVREKTISNCTLRKDGTINDPYNSGTFSAGILLDAGADQISAR